MTAVIDKGPTVISIPGNVAAADAPSSVDHVAIPVVPVLRPANADLEKFAVMIADAKTVAILGGDGCRDARAEVLALADKLKAPVGYSFRGKQWLEHDNPFAVGMTGLLGYGGAYSAINNADLLLLLGTDFPFTEFLPADGVKKVQVDRRPTHLGRRTSVDLALVGDVKATLAELLPKVSAKSDTSFLEKHLAETRDFYELLNHYVEKGPGIKPIRPEFLAATLCKLAYKMPCFSPIPVRPACGLRDTSGAGRAAGSSVPFLGIDGECRTQRLRRSTGVSRTANDRPLR